MPQRSVASIQLFELGCGWIDPSGGEVGPGPCAGTPRNVETVAPPASVVTFHRIRSPGSCEERARFEGALSAPETIPTISAPTAFMRNERR